MINLYSSSKKKKKYLVFYWTKFFFLPALVSTGGREMIKTSWNAICERGCLGRYECVLSDTGAAGSTA